MVQPKEGALPTVVRSTWVAAAAIFVINLPFGYWRAGLRKLSPRWFVAIHLPVGLAIALRLATRVPFRFATLPVFVAAFFLGQSAGGRFRPRQV